MYRPPQSKGCGTFGRTGLFCLAFLDGQPAMKNVRASTANQAIQKFASRRHTPHLGWFVEGRAGWWSMSLAIQAGFFVIQCAPVANEEIQ